MAEISAVLAHSIFDESDALAEELTSYISLALFDDSQRIKTSHIACSLSLEYWASIRVLLRSGLLPSAAVVHRAQFEAVTRSIWLLYAASDNQIKKFSATLSLDSEQSTKNAPQVAEMMQILASNAPPQAYDALLRFKKNSWNALNSYVHAGIHPIRRHEGGYPVHLLHDVLRNANGLAVFSCMQAAVLSGLQPLQREILTLAAKHPNCMPPVL